MRPAPYTFEEPTNLKQAFANLKDGTPIAGGQNLMPALRMRQIDTPCLVSLEKIRSFSSDILVTIDAIQIGALTTISLSLIHISEPTRPERIGGCGVGV